MEEKQNRREFLKKASLVTLGGITSLPLLTACEKDDGYGNYSISQSRCIGCGKCLDACYYGAVILPDLTTYSIDTENCKECGDCVSTCDDQAIEIFVVDYVFDNINNCVGCGDCIDECVTEGNCISYQGGNSEYSISDVCPCGARPCLDVCDYDAISYSSAEGKMVIDHNKCERCGECYDVCRKNAITTSKVQQDTETCTHCGKCYDVCGRNVISKDEPANHHEPRINQNLCTQCGDCITENACPEFSAIIQDLHKARINDKKCTKCGKCVDTCEQDAIIAGS